MEEKYIDPDLEAMIAQSKLQSMTIEATVIRADGRIEPQGVISGWNRNIFKHLALQAKIKLDRLRVHIKRLNNGISID